MGLEQLISELGIRRVERPDQADYILINGGGAMNDLWPSGAAQVLARYRSEFPDKPVVVGPSSYYFREFDFPGVLGPSESPVNLFCREEISREILESMSFPGNVEIGLSRDLALELENTSFIQELRERCREEQVLCALRKDLEGNAGGIARVGWGRYLPTVVRKPLSQLRDRLAAGGSRGVVDEILANDFPDGSPDLIYRDVSISVSFEEFCEAIASASLIITDRLHVAILGDMLGKQVRLIPGVYHKARGVFDYSLRERGNVRLVERQVATV